MKERGFNRVVTKRDHITILIFGPYGIDDRPILRMNLHVRLNVGLLLYDRHLGCSRLGPPHLEDIDRPLPRIKATVDRQVESITDAEATNVAKGFYVYLSILGAAMAVMGEVSPLNRTTPLISSGAVYNTDVPRPARNPPVAGLAYGVPAGDFIRFLRRHGLDDRVDGYGIHIYYSTPNNIDNALSICDGAGRKHCWLTECGGFPTKGMTCPLGYGPGDDVARFNLVSKVRETLRPFVSRGRLVNAMYYSWNSGGPIYIPACNGVARSGKLAIAPLE